MINFFTFVGVACIIISGIFLHVWVDGQQQRANFHTESEDHRKFRTKIGMVSGLIGFISLGIAGLIYFL